MAALVFLAGVLPFQSLCADAYARAVLGGAAFLTTLAAPAHQVVQAADGRLLDVERDDALRDFFDDPEQRPRAYGVLALWSWIAIAPLLSVGRRVRLALRATVMQTGVYALAVACSALAWYWRSIAEQIEAGGRLWGLEIGVVDTLGSALSMAALFVLPLLLGLAVYPGLNFNRAGNPVPTQ
jgi:hypothetical protein